MVKIIQKVKYILKRIIGKKIAENMSNIISVLLGRNYYRRVNFNCPHYRLGSSYGGWTVDLELIQSDSIIYSFGIGEDTSFDSALIERTGVIVNAFDPTPKSIEWVKQQVMPKNFRMHGYGIAHFDGETLFNPPLNPDHVSHTILDRPETSDRAILVPVKRLCTIMKELNHERINLLKMDIEGAEYEVVKDVARSGIRPDQLLIEFHIGFGGIDISKLRKTVSLIRKLGYKLFAVEGNDFSFCRPMR